MPFVGGRQFLESVKKGLQVVRYGIQIERVPIEFRIVQRGAGVKQNMRPVGSLGRRIEVTFGRQKNLALPQQQQYRLGLRRHIGEDPHMFVVAPFTHRRQGFGGQHLGHHRPVTGNAFGTFAR